MFFLHRKQLCSEREFPLGGWGLPSVKMCFAKFSCFLLYLAILMTCPQHVQASKKKDILVRHFNSCHWSDRNSLLEKSSNGQQHGLPKLVGSILADCRLKPVFQSPAFHMLGAVALILCLSICLSVCAVLPGVRQ